MKIDQKRLDLEFLLSLSRENHLHKEEQPQRVGICPQKNFENAEWCGKDKDSHTTWPTQSPGQEQFNLFTNLQQKSE